MVRLGTALIPAGLMLLTHAHCKVPEGAPFKHRQPEAGTPSKTTKPLPPIPPQARVGKLERVMLAGKAALGGVEHSTGTTWRALTPGQSLAKGGQLRTQKGVRAKIALEGGTELDLNEDSKLALLDSRRLELSGGELLAHVQPASKRRAVEIRTESALIRVKGTRLNVQHKSGQTVVDITSGAVEVQAAGRTIEVAAGERAVIVKGKPPRRERSGDLAGITAWAREIERPMLDAQQLDPGFGSLTARAPGRGKTERPLALAKHRVRVVIRGNIARTEIEQEFANPTALTLEGTYRFPLPAGASISRLALYVGNRLEEGEIVERRRARAIFNQIVNDTIRPRDPALLEWEGGRTFRMKIFPIPPRGSRRVVLAYTEALAMRNGRVQYIYPMAARAKAATRVGHFSLEVNVASHRKVAVPLYPMVREKTDRGALLRYEASDFVPGASFVANVGSEKRQEEVLLAVHRPPGGCDASQVAIRGARHCKDKRGYFMARLRPKLAQQGRAPRKNYLFVLDSSASTDKRGWATQMAALEAFVGEMDSRSRFALMACATHCRLLQDGAFLSPTAGQRKSALAFVKSQLVGGSSYLQGAFEDAAKVAQRSKNPVHVVYMGDGRPTVGEMREVRLAQRVVRSLRSADATLSVLAVGSDLAELFLEQATRRLGGAIYPLSAGDDLRRTVFEVVSAQYRPALTDVSVRFEGGNGAVHQVYPAQLSTLPAGGELNIFGRFEGSGRNKLVLEGLLDGRTFSRSYALDFRAEGAQQNAFIPRMWAQEHIKALTVEDFTTHRAEIVRVSKAHTVLSRATAFLVLENERMYREFRVKRNRDRTYWKGGKVTATGAKREKKKDDKTSEGERAAATAAPAPAAAPAAEPSTAAGGKKSLAPLESTPRPRAADRSEGGAPRLGDSLGTGRGAGSAGSGSALNGLRGAAGASSRRRNKAKRESARKPQAKPSMAAIPPRKRPAMPSRPMKKARQRRMRPKGDVLGGTYWSPPPPRQPVIVKRAAIAPTAYAPLATPSTTNRWRRRVARHPMNRRARRIYHQTLLRAGNYTELLAHARQWAKLDHSHPAALQAMGVAEAAVGNLEFAELAHGSAIEVRPWDVRQHRRLAALYRNKGDLRLSCAHQWAVMSAFPTLPNTLTTARCLAQSPALRPMANDLLDDYGHTARGERRRIERARRAMRTPTPAKKTPRGTIQLRASWSQPVDLDLAIITPRGKRISASWQTKLARVQDSRNGATQEVLALRWAGNGEYRVEVGIARGRLSSPIAGSVIIRARGTTRTIPFTLHSAGPPVTIAKLTLYQGEKRRVRPGRRSGHWR